MFCHLSQSCCLGMTAREGMAREVDVSDIAEHPLFPRRASKCTSVLVLPSQSRELFAGANHSVAVVAVFSHGSQLVGRTSTGRKGSKRSGINHSASLPLVFVRLPLASEGTATNQSAEKANHE